MDPQSSDRRSPRWLLIPIALVILAFVRLGSDPSHWFTELTADRVRFERVISVTRECPDEHEVKITPLSKDHEAIGRTITLDQDEAKDDWRPDSGCTLTFDTEVIVAYAYRLEVDGREQILSRPGMGKPGNDLYVKVTI